MIKVRVQTVHTGNKGQDQECNGDLIRRYQPPPSYLISLSRIFQVVSYLISLSDTVSMIISTGPPAPVLYHSVHPENGKEKGRKGDQVGLLISHISYHYHVYFKWFKWRSHQKTSHIVSHYQIWHPGTFQLVLLLLSYIAMFILDMENRKEEMVRLDCR